jgi:hypothetical protein
MANKNLVLGLATLVSALMVLGSGISVTNLAWGATINCNPIPDPCNGTGNSDNMFANDGSNIGQYTINGLAGSDTIVADETGSFGQGLNINGGDNNDKITAKRNGGVGTFANGDSGNDILTLSGTNIDFIHGIGGSGSDKITASGGAQEVKLFQSDSSNVPDGSKDTLNCGGAPDSTGFISLADGDIALHCKVVETSVQP